MSYREKKRKHYTVHCILSNTHMINSLSGSLTTEQTNVILDLYSQNTPPTNGSENALVLTNTKFFGIAKLKLNCTYCTWKSSAVRFRGCLDKSLKSAMTGIIQGHKNDCFVTTLRRDLAKKCMAQHIIWCH